MGTCDFQANRHEENEAQIQDDHAHDHIWATLYRTLGSFWSEILIR
jgi:hypothetical protein